VGRLLAAVVLVFAALGVGRPADAASSRTALGIAFWATGTGTKQSWTLRCFPSGGTLPHPSRACARLASLGRRAFAPVKPGSICTEIYGGPQVALVSGILAGRRIWARFQRRDGCEIARWNRLAPWLLPAG
jgi:Subtilisin inhibitor-like